MTTCYTNGPTTNGFSSPNGFPNGFPSGFQAGFPNACQGNACPDYTGNGCCMTGTGSWNGAACGPTSYAWTPSTYAQTQFAPTFGPQGTPWSAPWTNAWGSQSTPWQQPWNAACGPQWTPWNAPASTPWQSPAAGWNTPWTNQWSTPNAPFAQWQSQPFGTPTWSSSPWNGQGWNNGGWQAPSWNANWNQNWNQHWNQYSTPSTNWHANQTSPWNTQPWNGFATSTPWSNGWSNPTSNGFPAFGNGPMTNGPWCCVPTFTPWGVCFTTVPTSVYANLVASCTQPTWNAPSWQNACPPTPWTNGWTGAPTATPTTSPSWQGASWSGGGWNGQPQPMPSWNGNGWNGNSWNGASTPNGWTGHQRPTFTNAAPCTPNSGFTGNGCTNGFPGAPSNYSNTGKPFPATPTSGQPITPPAPSAVYGNGGCAPQAYGASACQSAATMMAESGCCASGSRNAA